MNKLQILNKNKAVKTAGKIKKSVAVVGLEP